MKIKVKLTIVNKDNEAFMGIGPIWLLERVKKFGSINKAAKDMEMSYVKAHKILTRLEKNLRRKILIKKIGGNEYGGAKLTSFAEKFISKYDRFQKRVKANAEKEFLKFVSEMKRAD